MELAAEVERELRGPNWKAFLADIFGNAANRWDAGLRGIERHRVVVNALTRLRFCSTDGVMDLKAKDGPGSTPAGTMPWFDVPGRRTEDACADNSHLTLGMSGGSASYDYTSWFNPSTIAVTNGSPNGTLGAINTNNPYATVTTSRQFQINGRFVF